MGLLVPECYVTLPNGPLTEAARHLRARLCLRSLRARNRCGSARSSHGESHLLLHQQLQHQILTRKGPYEVSELPARPSWGTARPPEWPDRQLQLLHWLQLMLLLQCCARFLLHDQASARRRAGGRQRTAPTCCRAPPKSSQRDRRYGHATPSPAFAPASVAGKPSRLLRHGGGYMRT